MNSARKVLIVVFGLVFALKSSVLFAEAGPISAGALCSASDFWAGEELRRLQEKNRDPYGLIWKPWAEEGRRLLLQGDTRPLGELSHQPVRLVHPLRRFEEGAPTYREMATFLTLFVARQGERLSTLALDLFGAEPPPSWSPDLRWPPAFLRGVGPYVKSYFDEHPEPLLTLEPVWEKFLSQFLNIIGVKQGQREPILKKEGLMSWVLSDRIERHGLLRGPTGESLIFVSLPCLDEQLQVDWSHTALWQAALTEAFVYEWLLARYRHRYTERALMDPEGEALLLAATQQFLEEPGAEYRAAVRRGRGHDPWAESPAWLYRLKSLGPRLSKNYFSFQKKPELRSDDLAFLLFYFGFEDMPAALTQGIMPWQSRARPFYPQGLPLEPILPPRGTLASLEQALGPQEVKILHAELKQSYQIKALRVKWVPSQSQVNAKIIFTQTRSGGAKRWLDMSVVAPDQNQDFYFEPNAVPDDLYFILLNQSGHVLKAEEFRLQLGVIPR